MTSIAAYLASLAGGAPPEGQKTSQAGASGAAGVFAALLSSTDGETGTTAGIEGEAGISGVLPDAVLADPAVLAQLRQLVGNDPKLSALLAQGVANAEGDVEAQIIEPLTGADIAVTADVDAQAVVADPEAADTTVAQPETPSSGTTATIAVAPVPAEAGDEGTDNQASPVKGGETGVPPATAADQPQTADRPEGPARNTGLENALQRASDRGVEKGLLNALNKAPQAKAGPAAGGTTQLPKGQAGSTEGEPDRPGITVSGESDSSIRTREGRALSAPREHVTVQRIIDAGSGKSIIQFHERSGGETAGTVSPPTLTVNVQASAASPGPASPNTPHVPVSALAVHIAQQFKNGARRFDIRLDPPELGRIDVRLDVSRDGQVTTHLVVERSETLDLLQRDARQLERALQDAGLDTSKDGMKFSLKDKGLAQGDREDRMQSEDDPGLHGKDTADEPDETIDEAMPPLKRYGVTAGLDIRI